MTKLFTSESVTEGHPDKICDQISDAVLDEVLKQDPYARVACETSITTGLVLVMGEISTNANIDVQKIVRKTINDIGYNRGKFGFDAENCGILNTIHKQSQDIALGVDNSLEYKSGQIKEEIEKIGAGDQGIMFGYACDETPELMPLPISLAHKLAQKLSEVRKTKKIPYLRPDGKTQVTVEYDENGPKRIHTVLISTQHSENVDNDTIKKDLLENVVKAVIPNHMIDSDTCYLINPTGRFVIGGPAGDSGLTGRKIIVDTYGGYSRHGGGAFSGKDPTKVDRSASYAARWVAKNIVAAKIAKKCEIQLSYAIGIASPISIFVDTFNTGVIADEKIVEIIKENFDLRPGAIIKELDLRKPIYKKTAAYGHFGKEDIEFSWEKLNKVEDLKKSLKNKMSI